MNSTTKKNMLAKKLSEGARIGIVAPSKPSSERAIQELENFEKYMKDIGLDVVRSKNLHAKDKYGVSAGTPQQRASDINNMFADSNIDAIWCLQGGETAIQLLDLIDYDIITKNPKLFLGKSDTDLLYLAIYKMTSLVPFHCCDPKIGSEKELDFEYTKEWFERRLIKGESIIEPSEPRICIRKGVAQGKILGCNLSTILKLAGTKYFPNFEGAILFIETYRKALAILLFQLSQLKLLPGINKLEGIVIGSNFGFEKEEHNFDVEDIIKDFFEDIPILKTNEFGHYQPHAFIPIGTQVIMNAEAGTLELCEDFLL